MAEEEEVISFDDLVHIFGYLSPRDLCTVSQVSLKWHEASMVGSLWKRQCFQRWNFCNLSKITPGERTWQRYYEARHKIDTGVTGGRPGLDYVCKTLRGHKGLVTDVVCVTGNEIYNEDIIEKNAYPIVASSSQDKSVALWNAREGKNLWRKELTHKASVSCLAVITNNELLASGDLTGAVQLWDVNTAQNTPLQDAHESGITSLISAKSFSTDLKANKMERVVFSSSTDGEIKLWDVRVTTQAQHALQSSIQIHFMKFKADYLLAAASKLESSVKIFDLRRLASGSFRSPEISTIQHPSDAKVCCLSWLPRKEDYLAVGYSNGDIILWDAPNNQQIHHFVGHANQVSGISILGSNMVSVGHDEQVCLWDVDNHMLLQTHRDHTGPVTGLHLDAYRVMTCSADFSIRTYRWVEGKVSGDSGRATRTLESCYTLLGGSLQRAGNGFGKVVCDYSTCIGMANDVMKAYSFQV